MRTQHYMSNKPLAFILSLNRSFVWLRLRLAIIVAAMLGSTARSETYTLALADIIGDARPEANYLQGQFDFKKRFGSIDSVRVELWMPSGFGSAYTTGNSTHISYLRGIIHDEDFDVDAQTESFDGLYPMPPWINSSESALQNYFWAQPNRKTEIDFVPYVKDSPGPQIFVVPEGQPLPELEYVWPDFLHSGKGFVTLRGWVQNTYHPLNSSGDTSGYRSNHTFVKPPAVQFARLVIEGTALVPEPSSIGSVCVWVITLSSSFLLCRRRRTPLNGWRGPHNVLVQLADLPSIQLLREQRLLGFEQLIDPSLELRI